jgi:hypothetical protein
MIRSANKFVLLSLFTATCVWAGGSDNADRVGSESLPAGVTNTFLRDNPDYKQRAGSFYETNYVPLAIDSLRQTATLTDEQAVVARKVLTAFIYDWLDAYIRGGGYISSESHGLVVAAMDSQMKLALREPQFQKYLAWRKGESNRPNAVTFLTITGGAGSEIETTAKSVQSVLSKEGIEGKIKSSPLGFHTLDFSSDFWASLKDDYKMKGKVSDVLTYEDIRRSSLSDAT